jgi:hypothetical protein
MRFCGHDAHFAIVHFYALGERPEMVAAIAPVPAAHPLARRAGDGGERLRGDDWTCTHLGGFGAVGLHSGLIPDRLELGNPILKERVENVGHVALDRFVKPL